MALTGGASHAASGTGSVAISGPAGLRVSFTTIPAFLGSDAGTPREYYNLGRVNVGNSFGYLPHVEILCSPQIVLNLPAGLTVVAWDFAPGVVASIQELVEIAPLVSLQPWDRNPTYVGASQNGTINGGTTGTTWWTYTVPAGRKLMLTKLHASVTRTVVPTAAGSAVCNVSVAGAPACYVNMISPTLGVREHVEIAAGPLVLNPGTVISATYSDASSGGTVMLHSGYAGVLFDA